MYYCDKCPFLSPKEMEQTEKKESHKCGLLKRKLFHERRHPHIPTPEDCPRDAVLEKYDEEIAKLIDEKRADDRYDDTYVVDFILIMLKELPPGFPDENII